MADNEILTGEVGENKPFEINMKYSPHILFLTIIFIMQFVSQQKESKIKKETYSDEHKSIGRRLMYKYIIILNLAKASEWSISPYIYEFFRTRKFISSASAGNLLVFSFLSSIFLGPSLIGYLIDKSNKKFPIIFYTVVLHVLKSEKESTTISLHHSRTC